MVAHIGSASECEGVTSTISSRTSSGTGRYLLDVVRKEMTCGVLQGSVLGTLLRNITFDDILKEEVRTGVSIICYAEDTLVVMGEDDIPILEWKVNTTLEDMTHWIEAAGPD